MNKRLLPALALLLTVSVSFVFTRKGSEPEAPAHPPEQPPMAGKPRKTMRAFASEAELREHFRKLAQAQQRSRGDSLGEVATNTGSASVPMIADAAKSEAKAKPADGESVTNNQHAGVDEGGIVKVHGDHLVVLRRGRLFTVRIGDDSLRPIDKVDAYAPGVDPRNDWYDEMLVSGDTIIVVGYSYGRGGTEINLFDIDAGGGLEYRSTYHLRSNDYYSSRNYASRLIGDKLIFYTPQYLGHYGDPLARFPSIRKWRKNAPESEFRSVVKATDVYRPERAADGPSSSALHTVTVCDLGGREFSCKGTGVLGAAGRVFYVSPTSVYVWTTDWRYGGERPKSSSMLYRMPLDGSAPSALGVTGAPVDQFSFLESGDEHLNVLVRSDGRGEQMWGSEVAAGDVALFRTPIERFSDGSEDAPFHRYRELPKPQGYTFQNRFVGDFLLYGTGNGWGYPRNAGGQNLYAVNWANGELDELRIGHSVDRIEQMGSDAVVVGTQGTDLYFTPVRLGGGASLRESYVRKNASQGELRSHGFFYKPDGREGGLLGLPIARQGRPGYRHLVEGSASVLFLRNRDLELDEIGELESRNASANDGCRASCVDWYGNARPLFIRNRVFALLGYELVEGRLSDGRISEMRRVNYSPQFARANGEEE